MDEESIKFLKDLAARAEGIKEAIENIYPKWKKERDDELSKRQRRRFNVDPETNLWFSRLYGNPMAGRSHLQVVYAAREDFLLDIIEFSTDFVEDGKPDYNKDFERFFKTFGFLGSRVFGQCEDDKFEDRIVPDDVTLIDKIREALPETDLDPEFRFEFGRGDNLPFLGNGYWANEYGPDDPLIIRVHDFPYTNKGWVDDRYFELPVKRTTSDTVQEAKQICSKMQHARDLYSSVVVPFEEIYKKEGLGDFVYMTFDPDDETFCLQDFDVPDKRSVIVDLDQDEWPLREKSHVFNDDGWDKEALNESYKPEIERHIFEFTSQHDALTFDYSLVFNLNHRESPGPLNWNNDQQVKERAKYHEKKYLSGRLTITLSDKTDPTQAVEFYKHMKAIDFNQLKERVHFDD